MTELTERQRKLLEDAAERRRNAAQAAGLHTAPKRQPVSREEYNRRLREMVARDNKIVANVHEERVQAAMAEWSASVGPRWADATVEDAGLKAVIERKVSNLTKGGPTHRSGLVLAGDLGIGKTWAAYAYARSLVEAGVLLPKSLMHGTESGLLLPLMNLGYERPKKMEEFLSRNHRFYLIDDVGRAFTRDVGVRHEVWYEVLNHAYENHIPIALTTNMGVNRSYDPAMRRETSPLEKWIGDAAYDRLMAIAEVAAPSGGNKRAAVNKMMDSGRTLGIDDATGPTDDPFAVLNAPPKQQEPSRWRQGQNQEPFRPGPSLSDSDLRPDRLR